MKLYGKKFARNYIDERVDNKNETMDAILWNVDTINFQARVKIQGSNELIVAHYPRNWKTTPYWMKPNNAVRILYRSGVRGYVEIIGEGRAIPTPISGSTMPDPVGSADGVISGCFVTETSPVSMSVEISSGTYRIDGKIYYLDPDLSGYIIMDDPAPMIMGSLTIMGIMSSSTSLDAAPAIGYFRYDCFVVGTDGIIDYVKGTATYTPTAPIKPAVPVDHILLGDYILVVGGVTTILNSDIGKDWTTPYPAYISVAWSTLINNQFPWYLSTDTPSTNLVIIVKDQYGNPKSAISGGWRATLTKVYGTGDIYSSESGWDDDEVSANFSWTVGFQYRRNQADTEYHPIFKITLSLDDPMYSSINAILLNQFGNPITHE